MQQVTAARVAAGLSVGSVAGSAALFTWPSWPWAVAAVAGLAAVLLIGLFRLREWARRVLLALGWCVSLVAAVMVVTSLALPAAIGESYSSETSRWLLLYGGLWVPFALGGLLGWLYFRRARVRALFRPTA